MNHRVFSVICGLLVCTLGSCSEQAGEGWGWVEYPPTIEIPNSASEQQDTGDVKLFCARKSEYRGGSEKQEILCGVLLALPVDELPVSGGGSGGDGDEIYHYVNWSVETEGRSVEKRLSLRFHLVNRTVRIEGQTIEYWLQDDKQTRKPVIVERHPKGQRQFDTKTGNLFVVRLDDGYSVAAINQISEALTGEPNVSDLARRFVQVQDNR